FFRRTLDHLHAVFFQIVIDLVGQIEFISVVFIFFEGEYAFANPGILALQVSDFAAGHDFVGTERADVDLQSADLMPPLHDIGPGPARLKQTESGQPAQLLNDDVAVNRVNRSCTFHWLRSAYWFDGGCV